MNRNLTEIIFILDRSGSMHALEADTIGGYNSFLARQKKLPGQVLLSTVLFDTRIDVLHDRADISRVPELTAADYSARGCTALLDAVGGAIHHIGNVHKYAREEDRPAKTMVVITTDGMENASRRYDLSKVREMIERQQSKYGWEFIFLGANMDAVHEAGKFGISADSAVTFRADSEGVRANFDAVCMAASEMRATGSRGDAWRDRIARTFKKESET